MSWTVTTALGTITNTDGDIVADPEWLWPGEDAAWDIVAHDGFLVTPQAGTYERDDLDSDEGALLALVRRMVDQFGLLIESETGELPDTNAEGAPVEPLVATIGQFANPWHDEIGRFAPKGTGRQVAIDTLGTDRPVTVKKLKRHTRHSVTTANGDVIELRDYSDVLGSRPDGAQVISDLLNGAADAHDLSPGMVVPIIKADTVDNLIDEAAYRLGRHRDELAKFRTAAAWTLADKDDTMYINPEMITVETTGVSNSGPFKPKLMSGETALGPARFTAQHEYGHLRVYFGIDDPGSVIPVWDEAEGLKYGMSTYGQTRPIEAHAEAFAEWVSHGGNPPDTPNGRIASYYADQFGWRNGLSRIEEEQPLAAAGPPSEELPLILGDSPQGPIYLYADGTVELVPLDPNLVASGAEFANPWHDEIGRFAPKGTGRQFGASQEEMRSLFEPVRPLVDVLEGAGATTYLVGGSVRDRLLGIDAKDIDIEVHGMTPDDTIALLKEQGARVDEVGASFGVLKVTYGGETHDFSFPRTEVKTGEGHTGFDVTVDPNLGIEQALARRDFTMNALAIDSDGNLVDPFGGVEDLRNGVLRHVGPAFSEDPLRILRGVQFAARLGLRFDPETAQLARDLLPELEAMHSDRVWGEFQKLGGKGVSMQAGVQALKDVGLDTRYGDVHFDHEPNLDGLTGDQRAAVALTAIGIDPKAIGAPHTVTRAMADIDKALAFTGDPAASRTLARELKYGSFEDAARIAGPNDNVDPRVLTGPLPALITGNDVMAHGIRGPAIGEVLRAVQRAQDNETIVTREDALAWLDKNAQASTRRNMEFANPWHDELGQFAPKGYGTDRSVSHDEANGVWSVTTADGSTIELHGDGADELTDEERSEALNSVADAWDLAPLDDGPPRIEIHSSDHHPLDLGADEGTLAWVIAGDGPPRIIHMIGERANWDEPYDTKQPMPSEAKVNKIRYTAVHEYGHLHMYANEMDEWHNVINLISKSAIRDSLSEYGRSRPVEAYAEAFAEYFGTAGSTENFAARRFAADLGWDRELPRSRRLAAAVESPYWAEIPIEIYETATGPIYKYADGTIERLDNLVAAGAGNPWHDEVGKFAPKGTGKKYGHGEGEDDSRPSLAERHDLDPASLTEAERLAKKRYDAYYVFETAQLDEVQDQAVEKAKHVPKPTEDDVIQGQVDALLAREGLVRAGGDRRGNNVARKKRAKALAEEFGDGETCPCVDCGQRLAADPATAEKLGLDALTQDKILVGTLGGSYKLENLVPSCSPCNQSRGDREGVGVVGDVKQAWGSPENFTRKVVRENGEAIATKFQARRAAILKRKKITWEEHLAENPDALPQDWDKLRRPVGGNFAATIERFDRRPVNGDTTNHVLGVHDPVRVDRPGAQLAFDRSVVNRIVEVFRGVPPKTLRSHHRAVGNNHSPQRSEFANPWHDEIGRFAPKGTGTKSGGVPVVTDIPSESALKGTKARTADAAHADIDEILRVSRANSNEAYDIWDSRTLSAALGGYAIAEAMTADERAAIHKFMETGFEQGGVPHNRVQWLLDDASWSYWENGVLHKVNANSRVDELPPATQLQLGMLTLRRHNGGYRFGYGEPPHPLEQAVRAWDEGGNLEDLQAAIDREISVEAAAAGLVAMEWNFHLTTPLAVAVQQWAAENLGGQVYHSVPEDYAGAHENLRALADPVAAAVYRRTQQTYEANGVGQDDPLELHRGIQNASQSTDGDLAGDDLQVRLSALSSWASTRDSANEFVRGEDSGVVTALVPRRRVFSDPRATGFGAISENEIVVSGDDDELIDVTEYRPS